MKKRMTKLTLTAILICCGSIMVNAQTIVKDKEDGTPVAYAHVFNQNSEYIGQTDAEGKLPDDLHGATAISISHVAYQPENELDNYMKTHQIPAITPEIQHSIEVTKALDKKRTK